MTQSSASPNRQLSSLQAALSGAGRRTDGTGHLGGLVLAAAGDRLEIRPSRQWGRPSLWCRALVLRLLAPDRTETSSGGSV